jgi:hypothetical protein
MNEGSIIWDYSKVPPRVWRWYFTSEEDHWMEVQIESSGLLYVGTDWSVQSGGGYFGGFQTFDEFFWDGPIQKMPEYIAVELREHLETHRVPGGAKLQLLHLNNVDGLVLQGAYVHLDDKPITVSIDMLLAQKQKIIFFDGAIGIGVHKISFMLVFKQRRDEKLLKVHGELSFSIAPGTTILQLETTRDEDGHIQVRFHQ